MDLQSFIENYGYAAILIGTFLEGETILVLAGLAAHQGYLVLPWKFLSTRPNRMRFILWAVSQLLVYWYGFSIFTAAASGRLNPNPGKHSRS